MRSALVDLTGWASILTWIGFSVSFAKSGNADFFQAVGVVGIAAGVGYFVAQRHAEPYPYGMVERLELMNARIVQSEQLSMDAHAKIHLLAKALEQQFRKTGQSVAGSISALSDVPMERIELTLRKGDGDPIAQLAKNIESQECVNLQVRSGRRNSEIMQAIVVILGTLQSGLGSYLIKATTGGA